MNHWIDCNDTLRKEKLTSSSQPAEQKTAWNSAHFADVELKLGALVPEILQWGPKVWAALLIFLICLFKSLIV